MKIVICVKIAITFSSVKAVIKKEILLKVFMQIVIKNIMFLQKYFDIYFISYWIYLIIFSSKYMKLYF